MNKWNPFPLGSNDSKKWKMLCTLLCCLLLTLTFLCIFHTNSAEIIADTLVGLPDCLHYEIKGVVLLVNATGGHHYHPLYTTLFT